MNTKVSVLIPIYNVSDFIEKSAISLFEQTFISDIEYIFVNDATPDDSLVKLEKIINAYPNRKNQIRILHHKENKGLAVARNTALNASKGDYIAVVDSDDYIEPNMIELLYKKAISENADVVVSDIYVEYKSKQNYIHEDLDAIKSNYFLGMLENKYVNSFLCNKLIKRNLYLNPECRVPEGLNLYEDRYVMTRIFYFAKKIVKFDGAFYNYVKTNPNSITQNKSTMHFENIISFWKSLEEFLVRHGLYMIYKDYIDLAKVEDKVNLVLNIHTSTTLRKSYANIFHEEETKYLHKFHKGKKLMIILIRNKLWGLVELFHLLNRLKHKLTIAK